MPARATCNLCGTIFSPYAHGARTFCKKCAAKADRAVAEKPRIECRECGKRFAAATSRIRYCSDACRADGMRRYQREYRRRYLTDPEKLAMALARKRAWAAADAARKRGGDRPQLRWPPRADPDAEQPACRMCGRAYARYVNAGRNAYCKPCRDKADREISTDLHVKCRACGRVFDTAKRSVHYCSMKCRADGRRRSNQEHRRRRQADPEKRALAAARRRAWGAARTRSMQAG